MEKRRTAKAPILAEKKRKQWARVYLHFLTLFPLLPFPPLSSALTSPACVARRGREEASQSVGSENSCIGEREGRVCGRKGLCGLVKGVGWVGLVGQGDLVSYRALPV